MEECYFYLSCRLKICNFTESNIPPWVFLTFFKLYKWYQIAQHKHYNDISGSLDYNILFILFNWIFQVHDIFSRPAYIIHM